MSHRQWAPVYVIASAIVVLFGMSACAERGADGEYITPAPTQAPRLQDDIEVASKTLPDGREVTCLVYRGYTGAAMQCLEPSEMTP